MPTLSSVAVGFALLLVVLALLGGLINMLRQGSGNRSQLMMRWRVGLQFAAIVVIVAALYFRGH